MTMQTVSPVYISVFLEPASDSEAPKNEELKENLRAIYWLACQTMSTQESIQSFIESKFGQKKKMPQEIRSMQGLADQMKSSSQGDQSQILIKMQNILLESFKVGHPSMKGPFGADLVEYVKSQTKKETMEKVLSHSLPGITDTGILLELLDHCFQAEILQGQVLTAFQQKFDQLLGWLAHSFFTRSSQFASHAEFFKHCSCDERFPKMFPEAAGKFFAFYQLNEMLARGVDALRDFPDKTNLKAKQAYDTILHSVVVNSEKFSRNFIDGITSFLIQKD